MNKLADDAPTPPPFDQVCGALHERFPAARLVPHRPYYDIGFWMLGVHLGDYHLSVDWREPDGFGLTSGSEGYGLGPDEVYPDLDTVLARATELIQTRSETRHHPGRQ